MTPDAISEPVKRRLALGLAGWWFVAGHWVRAPGEVLPECLIDALPEPAFRDVLGWGAELIQN